MLVVQDPASSRRKAPIFVRSFIQFCRPDPVTSALTSLPETAAYVGEHTKTLSASIKRGVDYNIGRKLPGYLRQIGCTVIDTTLYQRAFSRGEQKRFCEYSLIEAAPAAIEAGLFTQQDVDQRIAAMRELNDDETVLVITHRVWQVWGRKNVA